MSTKLTSGGALPSIELPLVGGGTVTLGKPGAADHWQVVIVYRGFF